MLKGLGPVWEAARAAQEAAVETPGAGAMTAWDWWATRMGWQVWSVWGTVCFDLTPSPWCLPWPCPGPWHSVSETMVQWPASQILEDCEWHWGNETQRPASRSCISGPFSPSSWVLMSLMSQTRLGGNWGNTWHYQWCHNLQYLLCQCLSSHLPVPGGSSLWPLLLWFSDPVVGEM